MNRKPIYLLVLLNAAAVGGWLFFTSDGVAIKETEAAAAAASPGPIAGPGLVESVSEEIQVGAEIGGKLRDVLVEEGDIVKSGQVVAVLENNDYRAEVASAEAAIAQREAELRRLRNGARSEERAESRAAVEGAQATTANAQREFARRKPLYDGGAISSEELEQAERNYQVAVAREREVVERHAVVDGSARQEDIDISEAELAQSRARLAAAQARLQKTIVRSPISGIVLRKRMSAGEQVSDRGDTPIVTVGDTTTLRVRMDVDETDVARLRVGQRAYVTADAYGQQRFWGRVVRVGRMLGKKNVYTDSPAERVDTKVLETLIELERGSEVPIGLRVDAFIETRGQE